jgi:hypothetical protein
MTDVEKAVHIAGGVVSGGAHLKSQLLGDWGRGKESSLCSETLSKQTNKQKPDEIPPPGGSW